MIMLPITLFRENISKNIYSNEAFIIHFRCLFIENVEKNKQPGFHLKNVYLTFCFHSSLSKNWYLCFGFAKYHVRYIFR